MSTEDNKALVNRYFNAAWNQGNPAVIDDLFAANFHHHNPGVPNGGSREGFKQFNSVFRSAFPDLRITQDDVISEGDKVVTRMTSFGKHEGDLPGAPRTGNDLKMTSITIHRIADGKLAEKWSEKDMIRLLRQIGVMPTPAEHAAR